MKKSFVILGSLAVSICVGQYIQSRIFLPDSLSGVTSPTCIEYVPSSQSIYVAGVGPALIVLDGVTNEKLARIDMPEPWIRALCYIPGRNVLYAAGREFVSVVDCASNSVVGQIPVGRDPYALCYDSLHGKVFCVNNRSDDVTVIDAVGDSVLATCAVGDEPVAACLSPDQDKVYVACEGGGDLRVLDAAGDSVLRRIYLEGNEPVDVCVSPTSRKVYTANREDNSVCILDAVSDTLLAEVRVSREPVSLVWNSLENKVYCACARTDLEVISCETDTVVATVPLGGRPCYVVCDTTANRVYCARERSDSLAVVDCGNDSVVAEVQIAGRGGTLLHGGGLGKVYCASPTASAVSVVDVPGDTLLASVTTGIEAGHVVYSPTSDKMYVASMVEDRVYVLSGATHEVLTSFDIFHYPRVVCYNPTSDKVYYANDSTMTVVSCESDSVVAVLTVPTGYSGQLCCNSTDNKVYATGDYFGGVTIIDGVADTVIRELDIADAIDVCYDPNSNVVAARCAGGNGAVFLIDGETDEILWELWTNLPWPNGMCGDSANASVYCADANGYVAVVECRRMVVLATIRIPGQPSGLCYNSRDAKCYVATLMTGQLAVIDGQTLQLVDSIYVGGVSFDAFYNPLSNRVYCNSGVGLVVIDGAADSVIGELDVYVYGRPALNSAMNRLYVSEGPYSSVAVIQDSLVVGVSGGGRSVFGHDRPIPTIVRGLLHLPKTPAASNGSGHSLLDITGRQVMSLQPGENDIRHVSPGVYFVLRASGVERKASSVHKVVIQR